VVQDPGTVVDDAMLIPPRPEGEREAIEIWRGPNIKPPPVPPDLPDSLEGRVLIVLGDHISTGSLSPDGVIVMGERSNIERIAEYTLQKEDPGFVSRAREWGGGFIVAGDNYGQGSSREHAALAPLQLGVRAVFAESFHRIHRKNLINVGILPLVIERGLREQATLGETWRLPRVRSELAAGAPEITLIRGEETLRVGARFAPTEREILLAGGLLRFLKEGTG
jgi:aconitate hydratase